MFIYNISDSIYTNSTNYSNTTNHLNNTDTDMTKLAILSIICASILVCFCIFTSDHVKHEFINKCVKGLCCYND